MQWRTQVERRTCAVVGHAKGSGEKGGSKESGAEGERGSRVSLPAAEERGESKGKREKKGEKKLKKIEEKD